MEIRKKKRLTSFQQWVAMQLVRLALWIYPMGEDKSIINLYPLPSPDTTGFWAESEAAIELYQLQKELNDELNRKNVR